MRRGHFSSLTFRVQLFLLLVLSATAGELQADPPLTDEQLRVLANSLNISEQEARQQVERWERNRGGWNLVPPPSDFLRNLSRNGELPSEALENAINAVGPNLFSGGLLQIPDGAASEAGNVRPRSNELPEASFTTPPELPRSSPRFAGAGDSGAAEADFQAPTHHSGGENFDYVPPSPVDVPAQPPQPRAIPPAARVSLPVITNLDVARATLEEEVKKGSLPEAAVEPILAKISPLLDKIAGDLESAAGDSDREREILAQAPRLELNYSNSDGEKVTQVIAQVLNTEEGSPRGNSPASGKIPTVSAGYAAPAIVIVRREDAGLGGVPSWTLVGKGSAKMAEMAGVLALPPKSPTDAGAKNSKRPIADAGLGKGKPMDFAKNGLEGTVSPQFSGGSGVLPAPTKPKTGLKQFIRGLVAKITGRGAENDRERSPLWPDERSTGDSLLKRPKLSAAAAILRFPKEIWQASTGTAPEGARIPNLPVALRVVLLMAGVALSLGAFWLVYRRRFFPQTLRRPAFSQGPESIRRVA